MARLVEFTASFLEISFRSAVAFLRPSDKLWALVTPAKRGKGNTLKVDQKPALSRVVPP